MPIARHRYASTDARLPSVRIPQFVLCDLEVELPTIDVGEGDIAYVKDSDKLLKRTGASWVEVAGGSVPDATTTVKGKVELATDGESAPNVVVQGNDARLSDSRTPLSHSHVDGDLPAGLARDSEVTAVVAAHEAASDPHAGYQKESEKAAANGYASLGADGKVPSAQLPAGGGGGATYGQAVLDFGAFPGGSDAAVVVAGQSGIALGSIVNAWLRPEATPDHTADEHMLETLRVFAGSIIAGTGFTIYAINDSQQHEPLLPGGSGRAATAVMGAQSNDGSLRIGGRGTRIWGRWTVAWTWA